MYQQRSHLYAYIYDTYKTKLELSYFADKNGAMWQFGRQAIILKS